MSKLIFTLKKLTLFSLATLVVFWVMVDLPPAKADDSSPTWFERILQRFQRPREIGTTPGRHQAGANRGCLPQSIPLTAFVPKGNTGLTYLERPAFWFYVPYTDRTVPRPARSDTPMEFVLIQSVEDGPDIEVYRQAYALPNEPDMVKITLPDTVPALEFDQSYIWVMSVFCQQDNPSSAATINGQIERVEVDPGWVKELQSATPQAQIRLYGQKKLWYDLVDTLVQQQQIDPNDPAIETAWNTMLGFVNLCALSTLPSSYCVPESEQL